MNSTDLSIDITKDELNQFSGKNFAFVTFGETMMRDTSDDNER